MPPYQYRCLKCDAEDTRIGAVNSHAADCVGCGGPMVRTTEDVFAPYFQDRSYAETGLNRVIRYQKNDV